MNLGKEQPKLLASDRAAGIDRDGNMAQGPHLHPRDPPEALARPLERVSNARPSAGSAKDPHSTTPIDARSVTTTRCANRLLYHHRQPTEGSCAKTGHRPMNEVADSRRATGGRTLDPPLAPPTDHRRDGCERITRRCRLKTFVVPLETHAPAAIGRCEQIRMIDSKSLLREISKTDVAVHGKISRDIEALSIMDRPAAQQVLQNDMQNFMLQDADAMAFMNKHIHPECGVHEQCDCALTHRHGGRLDLLGHFSPHAHQNMRVKWFLNE
jgi:hypothetical protein